MIKFMLVVLVFCMVGIAETSYANHKTLKQVLNDKQVTGYGTCYVKGNVMTRDGGIGTECYFLIGESKSTVWFLTVKGDEPLMVFEGNIETGETKLIWAKGITHI